MIWKDRIVVDPEILAGKPVIRGTRLAVELVIVLLAQGWSESEVLRNYSGFIYLEESSLLAIITGARCTIPSFSRSKMA